MTTVVDCPTDQTVDETADSVPLEVTADPMPLEVLERKLMTRAAEISAAEAEWMGWLAEYDRRRGWAEWGCVGPTQWLSWKCGLSPSAARERVRVANALVDLPLIRAEFAAGRLSYSKVQAVTRIANVHNETDLVTMATNASGAQLARICAGYRRSRPTDDDSADAHLTRSWDRRRNGDGSTTFVLRVPDDAAADIEAHLENVIAVLIDEAVGSSADDPPSRRDVITERNGMAAVRADAVAALLTGRYGQIDPVSTDVSLIIEADDQPRTGAEPSEGTCAQAPGRPMADHSHTAAEPVVAQAQEPPERLQILIDGARPVSPTVGQRLLCDPRLSAVLVTASGEPLAVGRSTRMISSRLRRALKQRDHSTCQFPGCASSRRLHAHHIIHWSSGGPTDIDNLVLVCHFHHHLVHEGGWSIDPDTRTFHRPDDTPAEPAPTAVGSDSGHLRAGADIIEPTQWPGGPLGPLQPAEYGQFDLPWTTAVLHHNEQIRRQQAEQHHRHRMAYSSNSPRRVR